MTNGKTKNKNDAASAEQSADGLQKQALNKFEESNIAMPCNCAPEMFIDR